MITSSLRSKGYPHGTYDRPAIRIVEARAPGSAEGDTVRLLVERKEANDNGLSQICIFYWLLRDDDPRSEIPTGEFAGAYDSACADISLTASCLSTGGYVVIDPPSLRGRHLGTYFMDEIVHWAKQWPDAEIRPITLLAGQATSDNRDRRNRFYEQFGVRFEYSDAQQNAGIAVPMRASELRQVDTWKSHISEHNAILYLASLLGKEAYAAHDIQRMRRELNVYHEERSLASTRPWTWLSKAFLHSPRLLMLICALLCGAAGSAWLVARTLP